jgi:hypothetical protein
LTRKDVNLPNFFDQLSGSLLCSCEVAHGDIQREMDRNGFHQQQPFRSPLYPPSTTQRRPASKSERAMPAVLKQQMAISIRHAHKPKKTSPRRQITVAIRP